jgi:hypothetical protein
MTLPIRFSTTRLSATRFSPTRLSVTRPSARRFSGACRSTRRLYSGDLAVTLAAGLMVLSWGAWGQTAPVRPPAPGHTAAQPRQEPCWQVAGISKAAMEQRKSITQGVRSQVEAVCADSSLTAQQRNEKIRQIHQQAKQQLDALITPAQMESMKACQSSRGGGHAPSPAPHMGGGGGGPCGQLPATSGSSGPSGAPGSKPQPENEAEN